jgi:hypothetical protein
MSKTNSILSDQGLYKRLMQKTVRIPESGCWIFMGAIKSGGYGDIWKDKKVVGAHRASYQLFVESIPDGFDVCHTCDVRCCINPDHLFVGTRKDNMIDCRNKERIATVRAKLTPSQVNEIKNSSEQNHKLAIKFSCSQNIISRIKKGQTYVMSRLSKV